MPYLHHGKRNGHRALASSLARTPRAAAAVRARVLANNPHLRLPRIPKGAVLIFPDSPDLKAGAGIDGQRRRALGEIAERFSAGARARRAAPGPARVTHRRACGGSRCTQERGGETPGRKRSTAAETAGGRGRGVQGRAKAYCRSDSATEENCGTRSGRDGEAAETVWLKGAPRLTEDDRQTRQETPPGRPSAPPAFCRLRPPPDS